MPNLGITQLFIILMGALLFGFLTAFMAKRRSRNPLLWFGIGFLFGYIAPLILYFLPKIKQEASLEKPIVLKPQRTDLWLKMWYYLDPTHTQQGPMELPDLIKVWREKRICEKSLVWGEGMSDWQPLGELPDLLHEFAHAP